MANLNRTDPERRETYLKDPDPCRRKMALPVGFTCGDCYAFKHCEALYAHIAADEVCDFYPNRFGYAVAIEAEVVAGLYMKAHGKSQYSQGREGKRYTFDGCEHVLLEDNGDRGLFQAVGKTVANLEIKPTIVVRFEDLQEVKDGQS